MSNHNFLAFDLGAESGRAIHGLLTAKELHITEINRFPNRYLDIKGRYHWDVFMILEELKKSLKIFTISKKLNIESIAIDTWGVDFGLLAKDGTLISMPYTYRDHQTDGIIERFTKEVMSKKKLYQLTGIQIMQFNTIFQLYALKKNKSPVLNMASDLLFIPDLLNYLLTGIKKSEFTIATTSQLLDPFTRTWNPFLFEAIDLPIEIMQNIVNLGTIVGQVDANICSQIGLSSIPLIAIASHDTASAISSVPAEGENCAYLSSGTWSLMGIEVDQPIVNEASVERDFTNEGGAESKYCFLKNICGLWLFQECKRIWDKSFEYSYEELIKITEGAKPFKMLLNVDAPEFYNPVDMTEAIISYCKKTNQPTPASHAEFVRCILESLAMKYRQVFGQLNDFSSKPLEILYVIGGGAKNKILCQLTANALGIPVKTGPSEATAIGNIMLQAKAMGYLTSIKEIRTIIRNSFESDIYTPQDTTTWNKMYETYLEVTKQQ
jgi:rhamnulokinase